AGANWRSFADIADLAQQDLDTATFKRLTYLADNEPNAGVMHVTAYEYWEVKPKDFEDPWFKRLVKNYRYIPKDELPSGTAFGIAYSTVTINTPKYLKHLQEQFLARGGILERSTVPSLKALAQIPTRDNVKPDILVNCSGLGSRNLAGVHDMQMFPTRGQIVVVKVPDEIWSKVKQLTIVRYGEEITMGAGTITYVIPRDNGEIVLGGTLQHWNYQEAVCEETTQAIMKRVLATRPDLFSRATILRSCVGLRPNRRGGVRVSTSVEQLDWNEGWANQVVLVAHNYGHAGFGYQASIGCANKVVADIETRLEELVEVRNHARTMSKL
ncbi:hypothetical protein BGZ67_006979, partial [Mortierella alpina]